MRPGLCPAAWASPMPSSTRSKCWKSPTSIARARPGSTYSRPSSRCSDPSCHSEPQAKNRFQFNWPPILRFAQDDREAPYPMATKRFILGWQIERQGLASRFAERAQQLIASPQAMGNYMTYRDARIDLPLDEWSDLGWMCSHIGPPKAAVDAVREAATADNIGPYSPDLI